MNDIPTIISVLQSGGVVATPTDTVYGLLGDATNPKAVARVYAIKGRQTGKALPMLVSDIVMAKTIAHISPKQEKFLEQVWPGKVSVVLSLIEPSLLSPNALLSNKTVLVRVPNHPLILDILHAYKKPLTGTSANTSDKPVCLDTACIREQFSDYPPDVIIEGGALPPSASSTIVDLTQETPVIIRKGADDKKVEQML